MDSIAKPETGMTSGEAKSPDGETLLFLATAFERIITAEYRQMLAEKLRDVEACLWKIDRALATCQNCQAMNGLADMIHELQDRLAKLPPTIGRRNGP